MLEFEQPGIVCTNISIMEDLLLEDEEAFNITLETTDENVILNISLAIILIEDNVSSVRVCESAEVPIVSTFNCSRVFQISYGLHLRIILYYNHTVYRHVMDVCYHSDSIYDPSLHGTLLNGSLDHGCCV